MRPTSVQMNITVWRTPKRCMSRLSQAQKVFAFLSSQRAKAPARLFISVPLSSSFPQFQKLQHRLNQPNFEQLESTGNKLASTQTNFHASSLFAEVAYFFPLLRGTMVIPPSSQRYHAKSLFAEVTCFFPLRRGNRVIIPSPQRYQA